MNDQQPAQAPECEHYYAWISPAGARGSARICQLCHQPDPEWLNHIVEIDRGHGPSCVHCEYADQTTEEEQNRQIDRLHGPGAAAVLDAAIKDLSVFGDD